MRAEDVEEVGDIVVARGMEPRFLAGTVQAREAALVGARERGGLGVPSKARTAEVPAEEAADLMDLRWPSNSSTLGRRPEACFRRTC